MLLTQILVLLHVFGAIVWTGGHLVLVAVVLPQAIRASSAQAVKDFESRYEPMAVPALLTQIVTGLWLAFRVKPDSVGWTDVTTYPVPYILLKLVCLAAILCLAIHAKKSVLPKLEQGELAVYAKHARAVTALSVVLVILGVAISTGGI